MIASLFTYLKNHKWASALALLLASGTVLAGMGLMSTSGYLISRAAQRPMIVDLFMVTAAVRFFGISRAVVRYFERVVSHDLTFKILMQIRTTFYRQLNAFPYKWMMAKRPGELLTNMITDIETLQNAYLRIISPVITAFVICTFSCMVLFYIDLILSLSVLGIYLACGVLVPMLAVFLAKGTGKTKREATGKLKVFLSDSIPGLHDMLWLSNQSKIMDEFLSHECGITTVQQSNAHTSGLVDGMQSLLTNLGMLAALVLSAPLVISGQLQGVMLAAVTLGVLSSFEALQGLANAFIQYENTVEASTRLSSCTNSQEAVPCTAEKTPVLKELGNQPHISFQQVSFAYENHNKVLDQISFSLWPGSKTAVVGPSGSGKSTIINLIAGFWEPTSGKISANGRNYNSLDKVSLRTALAVVAQDTYIFKRSIRDNLRMADPEAPDEKLAEILRLAGLNFLACELDMDRGSAGMKLSGGERQLFALARALLSPGHIWIFDELSANMDPVTERKVLDTLWENVEDRTLLMITHRLVDMEKMDQVIVLNQGSLAGMGKHHELLAKNPWYAAMYSQQMQIIRG